MDRVQTEQLYLPRFACCARVLVCVCVCVSVSVLVFLCMYVYVCVYVYMYVMSVFGSDLVWLM